MYLSQSLSNDECVIGAICTQVISLFKVSYMDEKFDARFVTRELMGKVRSAIRSNSVRARLDIEITLGLMKAKDLEQVAYEMERRFSWRLTTQPYVVVSRGTQGNIVAMSFYAGWLDLDSYGQKLFIGTYSMNL